MKRTKLGQALIQGLNDVIEHEKGVKKLRVSQIEIPEPAPDLNKKEIAAIRQKIFKVSQPIFASILSVTPATVKAWEQGLKKPSGTANRLMQILKKRPGIVGEVTAKSRKQS